MTNAASRHTEAPVIEIRITSPLWQARPLAEQTVREAIAAAAAFSKTSGEVSIVLADDEMIRALNRHWRGIDKPTNVLSFPASKAGGKLFGDIVVAYETLARECDDEDQFFLHHLAHLTVHGFLHLIGYDHQTDAQADEMEGHESKIMLCLNMPDPYLERDLGYDDI